MFYDLFLELCTSKGVTPSKACLDMGLSRSLAAKWKNTKATPSFEVIGKIADYFCVSADYLLGKEHQSKINTFYDKFKQLCDKKGVSCNKAALEIGLSNATPTKWKKTGATPDSTTLSRVALYFGCSIEDLLDTEVKKTSDFPTTHESVRLEGTYLRLAQGAKDLGLDDEDVDAILAIYAKHKKKNE